MMKRYILFLLLLGLFPWSMWAQRVDTARVKVDTLRQVVVTTDGRLPITVSESAKERPLRTPTVSDLIGSELTDKIMHPFAIKQRKRERHAKKMKKLLEQYDLVVDQRKLLMDALRREGIDPDSLLQAKGKR